MTVSLRHEFVKKLIARLVEAFAEETSAKLNGFGGATLRKKAKRAGCEPEEWYCVGKAKPTPDLAIEVVHTSGGIDTLEVYRRLGAREVWFFISGRFWIYRLVDGAYREVERSVALPRIDLVTHSRESSRLQTTPSRPTRCARIGVHCGDAAEVRAQQGALAFLGCRP